MELRAQEVSDEVVDVTLIYHEELVKKSILYGCRKNKTKLNETRQKSGRGSEENSVLNII